MTAETKSRISLAERPSIGKKIIAQQPAITFAEALAQVQRLKRSRQLP